VSNNVKPASGDAALLGIRFKDKKEVPPEELQTEIPIQ
jgi:hypothetical protein